MGLNQQTASELLSGLSTDKIGAGDVVRDTLQRITEVDGEIHAFASVADKDSLEKEAKIKKKGRLAGIPIALKDNL